MSFLTPTLVLVALLSAGAVRAEGFARHPARGNRPVPAGIPDGYVLTHNGFFHPSCVYTLRPDEAWRADQAIIGRDGVVHDHITPCAYPRFGLTGATIVATPESPPKPAPSATYNGYLLGFIGGASTATSVPTGSVLRATWKVPDLPATVGDGEDLAFFNGLELDATKADGFILQPVLDFDQTVGSWIVESESCCFGGNDVLSASVKVDPGDVIQGTVVPSGCDTTSGVCKSIVVTTADLTTGQSAILTADSNGLAVDAIIPATLETYGVTECDELPANGEIVFQSSVTDANGDALSFTYDTIDCILGTSPQCGNVSQIPKTCGWGLSQADGDFTLTFGTAPHLVDAGEDLASPQDAASVVNLEGDASATPEDGGTSSSGGKHGCAAVPLGAAPSSTGLGSGLLWAALVVLRRRRGVEPKRSLGATHLRAWCIRGSRIVVVAGLMAGCHRSDGAGTQDLSSPYPAQHGSLPQLTSEGGPVVSIPNLVTITYSDFPLEAGMSAFFDWLVTSDWLKTVGVEYGVGPGTHQHVHLTTTGPPTMTYVGIETELDSLIGAGTIPGPKTTDGLDTVYLLLLSPSTALTDGVAACSATFSPAYHYESMSGTKLIYAVTAACAGEDISVVELTAAEQLMNMAANPEIKTAPAYYFADGAWSIGGGEPTDLCDEPVVYDAKYTVPTVWSNAGAASGGSPCLPQPQQPFCMTSGASATGTISPGGTVTIALTAWSTAARASWGVSVDDYTFETYATPVGVALDKQTANNGDTVTLTVTAPADAKSGDVLSEIVWSTTTPQDAMGWPLALTVQ